MKLVSVHKLLMLLAFLPAWVVSPAQESWSLQRCIDTALVYNRNLQINRNNIAIGGERQKEAKENLLPRISANADYKYFTNLPYQLMPLSTFNPSAPAGQFKEAQFGVPHNINANIQLAMPLYNPQVYGAIESTRLSSALSELQYQQTREQVYYDLSILYYNAQILHHQLAFTDSNLVNTGRLLKNIELLHGQLLATGTDVNKVKLQAEQLATQRDIISSKYQQALNALKLVMGVSPERGISIETEIQFREPAEYSLSPTPDIRMIQLKNKLLTSELNTLNKSRHLPTLNLIASYGTTGFGYDKGPENFLKFYPAGFAGVQLSYPLFNTSVTQRKITQKKKEIDNNSLQYELVSAQNTIQVENATRQRVVGQKTVGTTKNQIGLAQTIYEQTILQQKQGIVSLTDVLLADNALHEAQQNYLAAVIDYLKADLALMQLTGNLSTLKK